MTGAIIGDIIGSTYERHNVKTMHFELFPQGSSFTDDTVMSVAVAEKLMKQEQSRISDKEAYAMWFKQYYKRYPHAGYGRMFADWAGSDSMQIQKSYGNGAAMRVSAIGYACNSEKEIVKEVDASCYYTHNHSEAKAGAQAVALCIYLARQQADKNEIKKYIEKKYKYKFVSLDEIRDSYVFDSRTSYSVPPAIEAFLESENYEDAVRKAVSIGGDSDTIACIAGGIAHAYYREMPTEIYEKGMSLLDVGLRRTVKEFERLYHV